MNFLVKHVGMCLNYASTPQGLTGRNPKIGWSLIDIPEEEHMSFVSDRFCAQPENTPVGECLRRVVGRLDGKSR